jgi:hypothetical protein
MPTEPEQPYTLEKTAMFASEIFIPGASNLIAGNVGTGVAHLAVATALGAVLAPTMPLLALLSVVGVRLNSYQKATTGANLWKDARAGITGLVSRRGSAKGA